MEPPSWTTLLGLPSFTMMLGSTEPIRGLLSEFSKISSLLKTSTNRHGPEKKTTIAAAAAKDTAAQNYNANVSQSHLFKLPTEVVKDIADYLPPSGVMALSLTCTRFHAIIASPILANSPSKEHSFDILAHLEYDLGIWNSRPLCGGCQTAHDKSSYWPGQLELGGPERRCKQTQQLIWMQPDRAACFNELRGLAMTIGSAPISYQLQAPGTSSVSTDTRYGKLSLALNFETDIFRFPVNSRPLMGDVCAVLKKFNIPICPHLCTADPCIMECYARSFLCSRFRYDSSWNGCPIRKCRTYVRFLFEGFQQGSVSGDKLVLQINRHMNVRTTPNQKSWLKQAAVAPDPVALTDAWNASWAWKECHDEIDKVNVTLNANPLGLTANRRAELRRRLIDYTARRDSVITTKDIKKLYRPLINHASSARKIARRNAYALEKVRRHLVIEDGGS